MNSHSEYCTPLVTEIGYIVTNFITSFTCTDRLSVVAERACELFYDTFRTGKSLIG